MPSSSKFLKKFSNVQPKLIVIVGPTASGKSALAISLAKKFNGEIISADSRQIYRHLAIGTGATTTTEQQSVPHYLLGFKSPRSSYTAAQFKTDAARLIKSISQKGKLPILVGGTGFYIDSLLFNLSLPKVKANPKLRQELSQKSPTELFNQLQKLDPRRAAEIDPNNPHRLIRALEIVLETGQPVPSLNSQESPYNFLKIGLHLPLDSLKSNISRRTSQMLRRGLLKEVQNLHLKQKLSWPKIESFGLIYREVAKYLQNKISRPEMISLINQNSFNYAKRQLTWWRRDKNINWLTPPALNSASRLIKNFLKT